MKKKDLFLIFSVVCIIMLAAGCSTKEKDAGKDQPAAKEGTGDMLFKKKTDSVGVVKITPEQLDKMKAEGGVVLVDVREPAELKGPLGSIDGAINIPLGQLSGKLGELDKSKKIVTICHSGTRSMQAANLLAGSGFSQVFSLDGGMVPYRRK